MPYSGLVCFSSLGLQLLPFVTDSPNSDTSSFYLRSAPFPYWRPWLLRHIVELPSHDSSILYQHWILFELWNILTWVFALDGLWSIPSHYNFFKIMFIVSYRFWYIPCSFHLVIFIVFLFMFCTHLIIYFSFLLLPLLISLGTLTILS